MIHIQINPEVTVPFSTRLLKQWAKHALSTLHKRYTLTICCVDKKEMQSLNATFRSQDKPTNVLAFPIVFPEHIKQHSSVLGDVILCPEVILKESHEQQKPLAHHWAHIMMHGILHLLGYDHEFEADEKKMQIKEIELLKQLGFDNPYDAQKYRLD